MGSLQLGFNAFIALGVMGSNSVCIYLCVAVFYGGAGPSTVAGMAATKGWSSLIVPAILTSTLGYALGTFIGIGLGMKVLRPLCS
jgi:uncharacterized membrane protein